MVSLSEDYDTSQSSFTLGIRQLINRILTDVVQSTGLDKKEICRRICQLPPSDRLTPRILHDLDNAVTKSKEQVDIMMLSTLIRYVIIPGRSSSNNIYFGKFNMYDDVFHLRKIRNILLHNSILPMYVCVDVINDLRILATRFEKYLKECSYVDCVNLIYMRFLDPMRRKYEILKALGSIFQCYELMGVTEAKTRYQKRTWDDDDLPPAYNLQDNEEFYACNRIRNNPCKENPVTSFHRKDHKTEDEKNQPHRYKSLLYSNKNCKDLQQNLNRDDENLKRREAQIRKSKQTYSIESFILRPVKQNLQAVSTDFMHGSEMEHKEFKSIDKTMTQCNTVWHKIGSSKKKDRPVRAKILTSDCNSLKEVDSDIVYLTPENIGSTEGEEHLQCLQEEVCGLQLSSSRDLVMPGHSIFDHLSEIKSLFIVLLVLGNKNICIPTILMYEIKMLLKLHKTSTCTLLLLTQPKTSLTGCPMTIYRQKQNHDTQYDVVFLYHPDDVQIAKQNKYKVDKILMQAFEDVKSELYQSNVLPGENALTSFAHAYEISTISFVIVTENFCRSPLEMNKVFMTIKKACQSDIKIYDNLVLIVARYVKVPDTLLPLEQFEEINLEREDPIVCARLINLFKKNGFQTSLHAA